MCAGLDGTVGGFRTRGLDHVAFPYVYLDATYLHVRNVSSQVTSMAVVVATGVTVTVQREILGLDVGDSEEEVFWNGFMTSLKQRGLAWVQLDISDQHAGPVKALRRCFRVAHQLCRVPFRPQPPRAYPKRSQADCVAAACRMTFANTGGRSGPPTRSSGSTR
jgi:transposase-like protein